MVGAETAHSNSVMISVAHLLACGTICSWNSSASYILLVTQLEKGKAFQVLNILIKWPDFILVCLSKKVTRITPFPPQTTIATILPIDCTLLNFSSFKLSCGTLLSISALIQLKWWSQVSIPVAICNRKLSPPVSYQYKKISGNQRADTLKQPIFS